MEFQIKSEYQPAGDQIQAIDELSRGINDNKRVQTLLGVTGSGKTFTMANVIQKTQRPTLILAHNKTLAAQLYSEFKEFFPNNAVEYFVSYYDYYQPEAYVPSSDMYIEKDASINDEIDKLRHSATFALMERRDVIVVSSVSCIYGLGAPEHYREMIVSLRPRMIKERDEILRKLIDIQYERNDINFIRGTFRVRGDVIEIFPINETSKAIRVEMFGDEIDRITEIDVVTGEMLTRLNHVAIYPATHYIAAPDEMEHALSMIEQDLDEQVQFYKDANQLIEAQRIEQRTNYDIEMLKETGYCSGVENYSRYFDGRKAGERPYTLLDYFPDDFILFVDESHVTLPQVRGMYNGDRARKDMLVNYGFRLPAAYDNRPLMFDEFEQKIKQMVCVSATPGNYELERSSYVIEQIIRPTGLVDPEIEVRPIEGQVDDLMGEINRRAEKDERVLITTLTKKMSERLTEYFEEMGIRVRYLHSDIDTLKRVEIIRSLRMGEFDVLVGINLLREGLDIPEVSLVAILDADKEGFLRSDTSLVQTIGRAARNVHGRVIMYADTITGSMERAINETKRRREKQIAHNEANNITPQSIRRRIHNQITIGEAVAESQAIYESIDLDELMKRIQQLELEMATAAELLEFEKAAKFRDEIIELKKQL